MRTWNLDGMSDHDIDMQIEYERLSIRRLEQRLQDMRLKRVAHSKQTAMYMLIMRRESELRDLLNQTGKSEQI